MGISVGAGKCAVYILWIEFFLVFFGHCADILGLLVDYSAFQSQRKFFDSRYGNGFRFFVGKTEFFGFVHISS